MGLTGKRSACRGELRVKLEFSLFFVGELAFTFDVFEALVDIHVAGCLVKEGAAGIKASLDVGKHFVDGREVDDGLAEPLTVLGVGEGFAVGGLEHHALLYYKGGRVPLAPAPAPPI